MNSLNWALKDNVPTHIKNLLLANFVRIKYNSKIETKLEIIWVNIIIEVKFTISLDKIFMKYIKYKYSGGINTVGKTISPTSANFGIAKFSFITTLKPKTPEIK